MHARVLTRTAIAVVLTSGLLAAAAGAHAAPHAAPAQHRAPIAVLRLA